MVSSFFRSQASDEDDEINLNAADGLNIKTPLNRFQASKAEKKGIVRYPSWAIKVLIGLQHDVSLGPSGVLTVLTGWSCGIFCHIRWPHPSSRYLHNSRVCSSRRRRNFAQHSYTGKSLCNYLIAGQKMSVILCNITAT
jgi:hypothetical protein